MTAEKGRKTARTAEAGPTEMSLKVSPSRKDCSQECDDSGTGARRD